MQEQRLPFHNSALHDVWPHCFSSPLRPPSSFRSSVERCVWSASTSSGAAAASRSRILQPATRPNCGLDYCSSYLPSLALISSAARIWRESRQSARMREIPPCCCALLRSHSPEARSQSALAISISCHCFSERRALWLSDSDLPNSMRACQHSRGIIGRIMKFTAANASQVSQTCGSSRLLVHCNLGYTRETCTWI